ncbi:MAG TPA: ATP-binding protein [Oculatellaceae cyanobacterium]
MAEQRENPIIRTFRNLSLARKGLLLFGLPAATQAILLIGLVIIQREAADFFPARAAQDADLFDSTAQISIENALTLKAVRDYLDNPVNLDEEAFKHADSFNAAIVHAIDLQKNFANKRVSKLIIKEENALPNLLAREKALTESYEQLQSVTASAVDSAKLCSKFPLPPSSQLLAMVSEAESANLAPQLASQSSAPAANAPVANPAAARAAGSSTTRATTPATSSNTTPAATPATAPLAKSSVANAPAAPPPKSFSEAYAAARRAYTQAIKRHLLFVREPEGTPDDAESAARERSLFLNLLLAYSIVTMAILAVSSYLFGRNLLTRLRVLADNGTRLASRLPLNEVLPGTDEIATLDKSFHDMSEAIEKSTQVQDLMMDHAADFICSINRNGRIDSVSNAANTVLGYKPEQMVGLRLVDFLQVDEREQFAERIKQIVATKAPATFEMTMSPKFGDDIELLWSVTWSGLSNSLLCVTHDITETKRAERVQKELLQMVSHDLRSPLVAISGFHEFAERGLLGTLDERGMKQIHSAKRSTEQMLALVNDLLEVERLESGMLDLAKAEVNLQQICDAALQTIAAQANAKGIAITFELPVARAYADEHRLSQVMINLLTNAIKFTPKGGRISIKSQLLTLAVGISVTDTGPGLPDEYKATIFERFRQIRSRETGSTTGTGLGLSICKSLVNLHGGEIWVDSQIGRGSTFIFTLPDKESQSAQKADSQAQETIKKANSKNKSKKISNQSNSEHAGSAGVK